MNRLYLFLIAVLLVSCATQPIPLSGGNPVPAERIFDHSLTQSAKDRGEVRFVRDKGFMGGGVKARLSVDGHDFAELAAGESLSVFLKPGVYRFSMIQRPNLFGYEVPRELEVEVKPPRRFVVRIGFSDEGPVFQPLTY